MCKFQLSPVVPVITNKIKDGHLTTICFRYILFICVEVLLSSQANGVMSRAVSLPNHTVIGQALSLSG